MNSLFHDSQSNEHPDAGTEGRKESNKKFEKRTKFHERNKKLKEIQKKFIHIQGMQQ